jgi:hypothetical protein
METGESVCCFACVRRTATAHCTQPSRNQKRCGWEWGEFGLKTNPPALAGLVARSQVCTQQSTLADNNWDQHVKNAQPTAFPRRRGAAHRRRLRHCWSRDATPSQRLRHVRRARGRRVGHGWVGVFRSVVRLLLSADGAQFRAKICGWAFLRLRAAQHRRLRMLYAAAHCRLTPALCPDTRLPRHAALHCAPPTGRSALGRLGVQRVPLLLCLYSRGVRCWA